MYKLLLKKPDGRNLSLYSLRPIPDGLTAPSPNATPVIANPHLRWHPLRGEWVAYASHRQDRTFLPPKEYNPLAPTREGQAPTELPTGAYEVAVFENLFPSLSMGAEKAAELSVPTKPGHGTCEVIVFTQDAETSLGQLPLEHIELLVEVWAERYKIVGAQPQIQYVLEFENRGVEVGVTLHHPHGQLYAYDFIPPIPKKELEEQLSYYNEHGHGLLENMIKNELKDEVRIVANEKTTVAFVPVCARYPYEVWIAPKRPCGSLADLTADERRDFARTLKTVLLKYDGLWNKAFPYLMVFHQAPTDGQPHPEAHLHVECYPPLRSKDKLKFLAGTELGAGMFANDSIPEEKAAELRAVKIKL